MPLLILVLVVGMPDPVLDPVGFPDFPTQGSDLPLGPSSPLGSKNLPKNNGVLAKPQDIPNHHSKNRLGSDSKKDQQPSIPIEKSSEPGSYGPFMDLDTQPPPSTLSPVQQTDPKDPFATTDPSSDLPSPDPFATRDPLSQRPTQDPFATKAATTESPGNEIGSTDSLTIGGYKVLKELGRGGMGVVYKAHHPKLNRVVALKMILSGATAGSQDLSRFLVEAEAIARLQHPNIIQLFEFGEYQGQPFFTLEFVPGGSLADSIKDQPLSPLLAAQVVLQIARGMAFAHEKGIVHRDLKPANILVQEMTSTQRDTGKNHSKTDSTRMGMDIKITDFGLAKKVESDGELTGTNAIMGSPCFMAPEQARGDTADIDAISDVYGIGAILYQVITGRPPFQAAKVMEVLRQVIDKEPIPPSHLGLKLDRDLETICLKCLEKEKSKRYQSAALLADDLERYLNHEPIQARPPGISEKFGKWVKRKPLAAALWGVSFLALVGLFASIAFYAQYQRQQAGISKRILEDYQKQQDALGKARESYQKGKDFEKEEKWAASNTEYQKALSVLEENPDLESGELMTEITGKIALVSRNILELERKKEAALRLDRFSKNYDNAQFYYIFSSEAKAKENLEKALSFAALALGEFLDSKSSLNKDLFQETIKYLQTNESRKIERNIYELFLISCDLNGVVLGNQEKAKVDLGQAREFGNLVGIHSKSFKRVSAKLNAAIVGKSLDSRAWEKENQSESNGFVDWFLIALEKYKQNQWIDSLEANREVLKEQGDHFWGHYLAGLCFLQLNQLEKAKAEFTVCINLRPEFAWPILQRALASLRMAQNEKNTKISSGELIEAQIDFENALKNPDSLVQYVGLKGLGILKLEKGDFKEAVENIGKAAKNDLRDFRIFLDLASAYQKAGDLDKALEAIDQGILAFPSASGLWQKKGMLNQKSGKINLAKVDLENATRLLRAENDPEALVATLLELGQADFRDGYYEKAIATFDEALKIRPKNLVALRFKANSLLQKKDFQNAGKVIDQYLDANGSNPVPHKVYETRGLIYAEQGKIPSAIEMYSLALAQNPKNPEERAEIRRHRGWAYYLNDAFRLSFQDFDLSLTQDKVLAVDALVGRGGSRLKMKLIDQALEDAQLVEVKVSRENLSLTQRHNYILATIYSQAYAMSRQMYLNGDPEKNQGLAEKVKLYRARALENLKASLAKQPAEKQNSFWNDQIEKEAAFAPIRTLDGYRDIGVRFPPKKKSAGTIGSPQKGGPA